METTVLKSAWDRHEKAGPSTPRAQFGHAPPTRVTAGRDPGREILWELCTPLQA